MHILFVSGWFPYPADNGSRIRVLNLLKQLSTRHVIDLLSFAQGPVCPERKEKMRAYCRSVRVVQYREFSPYRPKALLSFLSTRPRSVVDTYSPEMEALVEQVSADESFDVVVASQMRSVPYVLALRQFPRVFEEIELAVMREQFDRQGKVLSRLRYVMTWWKLRSFVARLMREFEGGTVVSEQERDLVMKIAPGYVSLAIVPNGVDLEGYTGHFGTPKPNTLIYPGSLTYSANFDAMAFFLEDIFPQLRSRCQDVTLRITGQSKGVPVDQLPLAEGVELTGYLDDIRPAVAQSWVCVVPLRIGGGTRLKILEAMALGTPVVSTTKGAEGLDVSPGENILIADEPAEFADALLRLLGDPTLRNRLVVNGRQLVEERYSWETCAQKLEQLLCQVVERGIDD